MISPPIFYLRYSNTQLIEYLQEDRISSDSLCIGSSISNLASVDDAGTLSCFVKDDTGVSILSCSHVLIPPGIQSDKIVQPGNRDQSKPGRRTEIAQVNKSKGHILTSRDANPFDAAITKLDEKVKHIRNILPSFLGRRFPNREIELVPKDYKLVKNQKILKIGCTTGITSGNYNGKLLSISLLYGNTAYRIKNVLEVVNWQETPFSKPGDSGGLAFIEEEEKQKLYAIGIVIGGSSFKKYGKPFSISYVCPIREILDGLNVEYL